MFTCQITMLICKMIISTRQLIYLLLNIWCDFIMLEFYRPIFFNNFRTYHESYLHGNRQINYQVIYDMFMGFLRPKSDKVTCMLADFVSRIRHMGQTEERSSSSVEQYERRRKMWTSLDPQRRQGQQRSQIYHPKMVRKELEKILKTV